MIPVLLLPPSQPRKMLLCKGSPRSERELVRMDLLTVSSHFFSSWHSPYSYFSQVGLLEGVAVVVDVVDDDRCDNVWRDCRCS